MENSAYLVIAAFIVFYGIVSKRLQSTIITDPIVFVIFGFCLSSSVSGLVTDKDHVFINTIANLTLILILFSDASRINLRLFWREGGLPMCLLGIGLPLTILAGVFVGVVIFTGLPFWQAAILATILAPTDAALAQAVINSERVPGRIREALNVESGLNDGICFPILLLFISLADSSGMQHTESYWMRFVTFQLILGPVVGIIVGYVGGKVVLWAVNKDWMSGSFQRLSIIGLSLMAFYIADLVGGNGFIAAFFSGLIFGNVARQVCGPIYEFGEAEGELFILLTFMLFGAVMVPEVIGALNWHIISHALISERREALETLASVLNWHIIIYALISLTIVRMAPVAISLIGKGLSIPSKLYLGWFGPRGAASILYVLLVVDKHNLSGENIIFDVTVITVLLSVFLHGLTAVPGSNAYASSLDAKPDVDKEAETKQVSHMPTRKSH
jgi:NhaP-type Na+/H+ or K+/H+ antiporter